MSGDSRRPADPSGDDFEPDRELCGDGVCLGVLDTAGVCNLCGCTRERGDGMMPEPAAASDEQVADFDAERRLCPDGACVGLLGADNRCKLCGHAAD